MHQQTLTRSVDSVDTPVLSTLANNIYQEYGHVAYPRVSGYHFNNEVNVCSLFFYLGMWQCQEGVQKYVEQVWVCGTCPKTTSSG